MATEGLEALQAALGASYRLERELGRGGMATVYLAEDAKHGRSVALKVLHPDLAASLGPERFRREITLAAKLQHPHILTVLDSGETATGLMWFTMPYVEGETLRSRLRRERQLSVEEALRIAREVADALQYAHTHGVIHRDIKPENILLTGSHALVADFGIARALTSAARGDAPGRTLTETGMAVGTPQYMSPEQAAGERELDPRTDVYSLGAVLYEMLAGEPPFTGPSAQAIVAKMMTSGPPSIRSARPSVPERVDAATRKALAPVPADRFATASELGKALETAERTMAIPATPNGSSRAAPAAVAMRRRVPPMAAALALGFLVGVGVLFAWREQHAGGSGAGGPATLAVLPFENVGDSADAYFADGITDEVRGKLGSLPGVQVVASASSNQYRRTTKSPEQIGRELGVRYLLVGRVRWEKQSGGMSRVRVDPELVQVADVARPTMRWQQPFDADLSDVFQVQADIAGKVAQELKIALTPTAQQVLAERPTGNLAAYDAFLKGEAASRGMASNSPPAIERALVFYNQAVALDSTFAPAWAQIARAEATLYTNGSARADLTAGRRAAERAHALAPTRVETALADGGYASAVLNDFPSALAAYTAALAVAPKNAELLAATAGTERALNRWDAAVTHFQEAGRLDPRNVTAARRLADTYLWLRRYPEAEAATDRVLRLDPGSFDGIQDKAMIRLAQGDLEGARAVLRSAAPNVDAGELESFMGSYYDLYWVLDDAQQRHLLTLTAEPFGGDQAQRVVVLAETYAFRGDAAGKQLYADSARRAYEVAIRTAPQNAQLHLSLALALAYLGRREEAVREGQRAVSLVPISVNAYSGPYMVHQAARVYLLVGEPDKALDQLEMLLKTPYFLTPAWFRIDPNLAPLHGNPRFERLAAG